LEVQIDNLNAEFMADETELQALQEQERNQLSQVKMNRQAMARSRKAFTTTSGSK
jgi:hypothetical protein